MLMRTVSDHISIPARSTFRGAGTRLSSKQEVPELSSAAFCLTLTTVRVRVRVKVKIAYK